MSPITILVVEDAEDNWVLLQNLLKQEGLLAVRAGDALQAIHAAQVHRPQVILLDLNIPGGNGFLVLERLKANTILSKIPVVIVTGEDPKQAEAKALQLGASAYLAKPVTKDQLFQTLRPLLPIQQDQQTTNSDS